MRHALVDEAESEVSVCRGVWRSVAGNLGFLLLPLRAVGEQVVAVPSTHDAGAGESQRDTGGIDGDPAAAPLLGDVGGCAGTAGWVDNEVAGVGGHEDAAFDDLCVRLDNIDLTFRERSSPRIHPNIRNGNCVKVTKIPNVLHGTSIGRPETIGTR